MWQTAGPGRAGTVLGAGRAAGRRTTRSRKWPCRVLLRSRPSSCTTTAGALRRDCGGMPAELTKKSNCTQDLLASGAAERPAHALPAMIVNGRGIWRPADLPARLPHAIAPVHVFPVRKVTLVHETYLIDGGAADNRERASHPIDVHSRAPTGRHEIALHYWMVAPDAVQMKGPEGQHARRREAAAIRLRRAIGVEKLRRGDCHLRVGIHEGNQPVEQPGKTDDIRIQQQEVPPALQGAHATVDVSGKPAAGSIAQHPYLGPVQSHPGGGQIGACVVDK